MLVTPAAVRDQVLAGSGPIPASPQALMFAPVRPAAVVSVLGCAGCDEPQPAAMGAWTEEACPIPGGDGVRDGQACVELALRTYVRASPLGR